MIRLWTWLCVGVTSFMVLACGMAFAHLYTNIGFSGAQSSEPDPPDPITKIGYFVGERLFSYAENYPGLNYAVILGHPTLFALGLFVVLVGFGSGVWLMGPMAGRFVGSYRSRKRQRSAEQAAS